MWIDFYNPVGTIKNKEEMFSDSLFSLELRLLGFPLFNFDLNIANGYFSFFILGFGFLIGW